MPPENSTPEDAQPLARPVHDQPLARAVGEEEVEPKEAPPAEEQQEEAPQPEAEEKGPVEKVLDKAQENGWVYDSVAQQVRERGLASKADELINRAKNMLTGG